MAYLKRILRSKPSVRPCLPARLLPSTKLVEEEYSPEYSQERFYPMRLYETLNDRYQVVSKLGPGVTSTAWLAKDLHQWRWLAPRYVAIKVKAANTENQGQNDAELSIIEHILNANPNHRGKDLVANILGSFTIPGPHGVHTCMVFSPLCEPLWMLQHRFERKAIPLDVLKPITRSIVEGLRYLHEECHVIHTDITPDNIMMSLRNPSTAALVDQVELAEPSPRKQLVDRSIYLSRNIWTIPLNDLGAPVLQGFRNAVHGDRLHSHTIQLAKYQCPEISLGMEWSYPADIWNLGAVLWELFFGGGPFDQPGNQDTWTEAAHVARVISLLGPPPLDVLQRGKRRSQYFDEKGHFKFPDLIPKLEFRTNARSAFAFIVPIICALSLIPTYFAWAHAGHEPGKAADSDFFQLVASVPIQLLGISTAVRPIVNSLRPDRAIWIQCWTCAGISPCFTVAALPLYVLAPSVWSGISLVFGSVVQSVSQLQLLIAIGKPKVHVD